MSFGRSLRDPGVERPRLRKVGSGRSPPASLGFDRNTPTSWRSSTCSIPLTFTEADIHGADGSEGTPHHLGGRRRSRNH